MWNSTAPTISRNRELHRAMTFRSFRYGIPSETGDRAPEPGFLSHPGIPYQAVLKIEGGSDQPDPPPFAGHHLLSPYRITPEDHMYPVANLSPPLKTHIPSASSLNEVRSRFPNRGYPCKYIHPDFRSSNLLVHPFRRSERGMYPHNMIV